MQNFVQPQLYGLENEISKESDLDLQPVPPLFDKQHLMGIMHLPKYRIVYMRLDGFPGAVFHKSELLRQVTIDEDPYRAH